MHKTNFYKYFKSWILNVNKVIRNSTYDVSFKIILGFQ